MRAEQDGDDSGGRVNRQPDVQTPIQPAGLEKMPPNSTADKVDQGQSTNEEIERDIKSGEKWLIGIGICTLLINSLIAIIYWGQLKEMRKATHAATQASQTAASTLQEMKTGSGAQDTHTLAQQAVTQALQTTALATAAEKQATETENLANDALIQAKAANALAVQAQRSADYAKQSIDTAINSERPWLGISSFNAENFVEGSTAKLHFTFYNSGKRPASASTFYASEVLDKFPGYPRVSPLQHPSVSFLLPGAFGNGALEYDVPKDAFSTWKRNHQVFYFMVEIVYTDVGTSTSYITHYCTYYDPTNKDIPWPLCPGYNEAR